jgi:hypothetical protein
VEEEQGCICAARSIIPLDAESYAESILICMPDLYHGVDHSISSLDTSAKSRYSGRDHDDAPFVQHGSKNYHHVVCIDGIKILGQISLHIEEIDKFSHINSSCLIRTLSYTYILRNAG